MITSLRAMKNFEKSEGSIGQSDGSLTNLRFHCIELFDFSPSIKAPF